MKPTIIIKKWAATLFITVLMNHLSALAAASTTQLVFTTQPTNLAVGTGFASIVVQLADRNGTNVAQSGTSIAIALNKNGGLTGATSLATDASGKVSFTNLNVNLAGNSYTLIASASGLKSATSSAFNVVKGGATVAVTSSTNNLVYGQSITFTATVKAVAPATNVPTGTVTFKDGSATLGTATLNASGLAAFSTNRISAASASHIISAVYGGDTNLLGSTVSNFLQNVSKLALTVSGITASNKFYDGTTTATLNFTNAKLATVLASDTVTLTTTAAKGTFADKTVGVGKTVSISGLALAGVSAGNYAITAPTTTASITSRSLVITAKGANKIYDGTANATVTLADNRVAGDVFTNGYAAAAFASKYVGTAIPINVNGLVIGGTDAGNYSLSNLNTTASANITPAPLTVSGILASNKIYDATTTATLNCSNASLATVFIGDVVALNTTAARGVFASKNIGTGKTVQVSGLTIAGTNAGNYLLIQPVTTASITPRNLAITARGVNKIYNGTTVATVTLTDNHLAGDALTDTYTNAAFASKNVGTSLLVTVAGLAISGTDAANYTLTNFSATATANITPATLTASGVVAGNKIYDGTTAATLNFSNAALATVFAGDAVTLNATNAKGVFASKNVGTNKLVAVSALALAGTNAGNYTLTQPTTTANITARSLTLTAKGVNKIYDGTNAATVTLTDNRVAGDSLADSYASAAFTNKNAGTNILINVFGLAIAGTDSVNYTLSATNTTATANISAVVLTWSATSLTRPYATTNPVLVWVCSGFVAGEALTNSDVTGSPALTTTAKTNSIVGAYPITITKGTLASINYSFKFVNGVLTVTKADTTAQLTTTINPALTNQNITFAAQVTPLATTVLPPTGSIQFKNGTNKLGSAISVSTGLANVTVLAAALGQTNAVITAEYSDPAGNFNSSTNSLTQSIVAVVTLPPPSKMSLVPSFNGRNITAQLAGVAGQTYVIQASTDMIHWTAISTNVADVGGAVSLVDSNAVAYPSRFYRAYSP